MLSDKARACERIHNLMNALACELTRDEYVYDYSMLGLVDEACRLSKAIDELHAAIQVIYLKESPQVH